MPANSRGLRNADRSRAAILDAAENLFAEVGYADASLEEIGRAAGVSRGTPAYFFGTKRGLYEATLTRIFSEAARFIDSLGRPGKQRNTSLRVFIVEVLRFLHGRPTFMRLIDREVLSGASFISASAVHRDLVNVAIDSFRQGLLGERLSSEDARHHLLTLLGMCAFPLTHAPLVEQLGFDVQSAGFIESRADHIVSLFKSKALSKGK